MNPTLLRRSRRPRRGSALITVILVILVLSIIGIGIAYFTQVEDRISGNDRLVKEGFYAAEAGLRFGERLLQSNASSNNILSTIYQDTTRPTLNPPGGGFVGHLLNFLPCLPSTGCLNQAVPMSAAPGGGNVDQAVFSLYVRNNVEDPGGEKFESDALTNLISVGVIQLANGGGITKILEEQIQVNVAGTSAGTQKQANQGGTGGGATQ